MPEQPRPDEVPEPNLACGACQKEIPREQAESRETNDMVMYFCGFDCYQEWTKSHPNPPSENAPTESDESATESDKTA